ncbi:unnamed protein product, partial [marine sediment metagenome]
MKRKILTALIVFVFISGFSSLKATDLNGKITLSPKGKPYGHGSVLLRPIEEEYYLKADIDKEGNFFFKDLRPGKYEIKMDLFALTPFEGEIEIKDEETIERNFSITL